MASVAGSKGGIPKEFQKRLIEVSIQKKRGGKKNTIETDRKQGTHK